MVPAEYLAELQAARAAASQQKGALTIQPVTIDPLGAVGDVPWIVHYTTLNVRTQPSTSGSSVVGSLSQNQQVTGTYYLVVESDEEWLGIQFGGQERFIARPAVYRVHPTNTANIASFTNLPYGQELVNRWWGNPSTYAPTDLVTLPTSYTNGLTGRQLRSEVATAVRAMIDQARLDGVNFYVSSPYRSWASQKSIFDTAVNNDGLAQRYSAPPGHSEHQLGATMDFAANSTGQFLTRNSPEHLWLQANGPGYGFRQSYTQFNTAETGYIEEPWHWRYIGVASVESWSIY